MFERRVDFVFEFLAVDGCSAPPSACRVTGLEHEVGNYTVEENVVVVTAAGELSEVFACLKTIRLISSARHRRRIYLGRMVVV